MGTDSDYVEADEYVAGHTTLQGENVLILKMLPEGSSGVTSWRAPSLGCERLQYTKDSIQANGSIETVIEQKLISFKLGAPAARLFYVPHAYTKLIPSQALREEMKVRGVRWDDALTRRAQSEDADYYRMMREDLRSNGAKE